MPDLFREALDAPLAELLRPKTLDEVVGQGHLIGPGKPLRLAFEARNLHSMILWGPPGVGKTTLARLMANVADADFIALSAVFAGVKDIRSAMDQAQEAQRLGRRTLLFVDEIHRFNKAQQDGLLPFVESGLVTLIGATTENPSFEINSALLSRTQVHVLEALTEADLSELLTRVFSKVYSDLVLEDEAAELFLAQADGDARRLLNAIQQAATAAKASHRQRLGRDFLGEVLGAQLRRFDKGGDQFYDQISALHKSVRGSHPDAALYWFCRMLDGGADPRYLARRIVRMAWEDIGLADPRAMDIVEAAAACFDRLGSPEGELALAQAVIYLAVAAKSNAGYRAYNEARAYVQVDQSRPVPPHLRNAPSTLMKNLGMGQAYRYAHDEPNAYAAGESYLPEGMPEPGWYRPVRRGLEEKIAAKLDQLKSWDEAAQKTSKK